jgi:hypothetical protein
MPRLHAHQRTSFVQRVVVDYRLVENAVGAGTGHTLGPAASLFNDMGASMPFATLGICLG